MPSYRIWYRLALGSQLALLLYLQVAEWIDLFPWNDVRRGNSQGGLDLALGLAMMLAIAATYKRWRPGVIAGAVLYLIWMALQVWTFWVPYVFGASPRWARIHAANFAQTIQWLPASGNHLPPDANHVVLQLLVGAALAATSVVAWRTVRKR